jgi:hypothetical protein
MTQRVYVIYYEHRHGTDVSAYATQQAANRARADLVMDNLVNEVTDENIITIIKQCYIEGEFDRCYDLYKECVEDENITIEECRLNDASVEGRFVVVDVDSELAHVVALWPYAGEHGLTLCQKHFCWWREGMERFGICPAYLPHDVRTVTCLECIAGEQAPT